MGTKKQDTKASKKRYSNHYDNNEWNKLLDSVKIQNDDDDGGDEGGGGFTHWRYESEEFAEQSLLAEELELTPEGSETEQTTSEDSKQSKSKKADSSWKKGSDSTSHRGNSSTSVFQATNTATILQQAKVSGVQGSGQANIGVHYNHAGVTRQSGGHAGRLFANILDNNTQQQARGNGKSSINTTPSKGMNRSTGK